MEFIKCGMDRFGEVCEFYDKVVEHLNNTINYPKWDDGHPCAQGIESSISKGEQYIVTDDGAIVGATVLNDDPEGYYEAGEWRTELGRGGYMCVHLFGVLPSCKRSGVGSYMLVECIKLAKSMGYKEIRLDTVPDNTPAIGLYTKNGFTYAGTKDLRRDIPQIPVFNLYQLEL